MFSVVLLSTFFFLCRWMNWVQLSSFGEIKLSFNISFNFSPRHRRNEVTPRTNTSASAAVSVSSGFIARMTKLTYLSLLPPFQTIGSSIGTRCSTCPNPATTNRRHRPAASPSRRRTGTSDRKTMAAPALVRRPVPAETRKTSNRTMSCLPR